MRKKIILSFFVFILALGAGFYIYFDLSKMSETEFPTSNISNVPKQPEQKAEINIPDLDRPINIPNDWPANAQKLMKLKIESLISDLKKNLDSFENWLNLGVQRKAINDYEGARECWEYAEIIRPLNYISFNNLGELYGYYFKNYEKAEKNYLTAIKNGPDQIYIYRNLYEFYRNALKDDAQAKAILQKGIAANPDISQDLKYLLDNF
jgi:tetratricopeptide (TPR) repeat protein